MKNKAEDFRRKYAKEAEKTLDRVELKTAEKLKKAISKLPEGDIKRLEGKSGLWRLTVGDWRVVFSFGGVDENGKIIIHVEKIEPRGQIYKHLH